MEEFGKILRAPSLKRGKAEERISDRIKLEKVLGVTVASNAALASDSSGTIAYPAGCTVVLFNTKTAQQHHIINTSRKTITSLAFSSCDRYIVTGECGHQPAVRVWDLYSDPTSTGHPGLAPQPQQVCEFTGHKYGVNCVAFSPSGKYVVSVGTQHDMIVNVWDWKNNVKVASNKVSTKVKAVAFAENGNYFVTVGNRHVKFWYLEYGRAKYKEAVPLMGRSAILGEQRNNYFCDVACGKAQCGDSTYAITRSGLLCEFNNRRLLDKWVELRTTSANCITVGENYIFVGCAEGIIRCFDPATLCFITTLPRTHYLGVDVSLGNSITHMASPPPDAKYPDTVAITYSEATHKLTSVYNDHSVYVWDVFNIKRVGKSFSFLYHSACIWGVEMAPPASPLPAGSFLTCSSDDTIRVWSLDKLTDRTARGMFRPNVYSNELLKVVYVDKDLSYIKDLDLSASNSTDSKQQGQDTSYDGRNGVRCIRISPDGKHLASGDRSGNIRVHDTSTMRELCKIEAHDAEVLCLEYQGGENDVRLMASASRDRLLHVFDVKRGYEFMQTLDDHSSSITAVRFLANQGNVQMVSCGADKSVIFRSLEEIPTSPGDNGDHLPKCQFVRDHNATGKTTLYDMEVDAGQKHVITACQDRNVRIYSCNTGKHTKSFKGSTGDDGTLIKVVLDRSGIYLASSCTDKSLSVYDYYSGECMATMCGHSELATGLRFTNDCKRLISASGDGCIFVWRVPHDMVVTMHARLSQQAMRQGKTLDSDILSDGNMYDAADANYRFSIGPLPQWARKQLSEDTSPPPSLTSSTKNVAIPKGRWAQRASESTSTAKSWSAVGVIPPPSFPTLPTEGSSNNNNSNNVRFDSDGGSKDSSLEETHRTVTSSTGSRETHVTMTKQMVSSNITLTRGDTRRDAVLSDNLTTDTGFESTAHDGDIDSDNEYRQRPLYYPTQVDSASGSEFTVTNIDADELRKSQRRSKKSTSLQTAPQILIQQPSLSTYGSQDSDDDEDEASTPSGENTDRNPMSLFSVSSESLDQLVTREKYLQSTFESMDAAGNGEPSEPMTSSTPHKSSISSKFLTRTSNGGTSDINQAAINAVKQTKSDPEALKKRQLLSKRIAETKKKLESVGHSSPLKYSQSIHDLSHVPERDKWSQKKQGNNLSTSSSSSSSQGAYYCGGQSAPTNDQNVQQPLLTDYYLHNNSSNISRPSSTTATNNITCNSSTNFDSSTPQQFHQHHQGSNKNYCDYGNMPSSCSVPSDLQLCGCYMQDIAKNTSQLSHLFDTAALHHATTVVGSTNTNRSLLADLIKPRKLKLDKTLAKYKMHKSLPVSPVSEERRFSDFVEQKSPNLIRTNSSSASQQQQPRKSFSYFIDLRRDDPSGGGEDTSATFRQICSDIERFSHDFNRDYEQLGQNFDSKLSPQNLDVLLKPPEDFIAPDEEQGSSFSSDSLEEDYSFRSVGNKKKKNSVPPRRCMSSNELSSQYLTATGAIAAEENDDNGDFHELPKSESFYLNQNINRSQDSILSDDNQLEYDCIYQQSHCNSMESILSNESDCKSAPLEALFAPLKKPSHFFSASAGNDSVVHSQSLPKSISEAAATAAPSSKMLKTSQTQTDFATPQELVAKKSNASADFQEKLLRFESNIANNDFKKPSAVAFFVQSDTKKVKSKNSKNNKENPGMPASAASAGEMYIPTLESKNRQYKSKFCNVLNNRPEFNVDLFQQTGAKNNKQQDKKSTVTAKAPGSVIKFEKNTNQHQVQETSSLDRHLFTKSPIGGDKVCHKPPKAVRRHSSKTRRTKTSYEYVRKEDYYYTVGKSNNKKKEQALNNKRSIATTDENTIELNYKEKNVERDLDQSSGANILTELYDSLDKTCFASKIDQDSLEVNLNHQQMAPCEQSSPQKPFDSLDSVNLWSDQNKYDAGNSAAKKFDVKNTNWARNQQQDDAIQFALENIKILNEIQRKINRINTLVDVFKKNMCTGGKVRALSTMYETMTQSYYNNDLSSAAARPPTTRFRRRHLSLPSFVERRLNYEATTVTTTSTASKGAATSVQTAATVVTQKVKNVNLSNVNLAAEQAAAGAAVVVEDTSLHSHLQCHHSTLPAGELLFVPKVYLEESSPDSSLRRSCSLSDLSMQKPVVSSKKIDQGMKKPQTSSSHHISRPSSRYTKNTNSSSGGGMMTRSRSSGVLNQQSDSENETTDKKVSRLMRPTISSHNKINSKTATLQQRKKQSYSTSNLNTVGTMDGVSTSDDDLEQVPISSIVKPTVPPRTRQTYDGGQQGAPQMRRHLNNKENKPLKARHTIHFHHHRSDPDDTLTNDDIENANRSQDLSTVEISQQLCDDVIQQLTKAADNVLELYSRLNQQIAETSDGGRGKGESSSSSSSSSHHHRHNLEKTDMVKHLEMSILQTHKVFHDCIFRKLRQNHLGSTSSGGCSGVAGGGSSTVNGSSSSTNQQQPQSVTAADVNQTDTVKKLHDLVSKGSGGTTSSVVNMMEQYSDILWEMAQQKIHGGSNI